MNKIYWHPRVDVPRGLPSEKVKAEISGVSETTISRIMDMNFSWYTIWPESRWLVDLSDVKMEVHPCREKPYVYLKWDDYIPYDNGWSIDFDVWKSFWDMEDKDNFIKNVENLLNKDRSSDNWIHIDSFDYALVWAQNLSAVNLVDMYNKWDVFEVVEPTYISNMFAPHNIFQNWYVDVRSKKTWKVYRAISFPPKGSKKGPKRVIKGWRRIAKNLNFDKKIAA